MVPPPIPKAFGTPKGGLTCWGGSAGRDLGVDFNGALRRIIKYKTPCYGIFSK